MVATIDVAVADLEEAGVGIEFGLDQFFFCAAKIPIEWEVRDYFPHCPLTPPYVRVRIRRFVRIVSPGFCFPVVVVIKSDVSQPLEPCVGDRYALGRMVAHSVISPTAVPPPFGIALTSP